MDLSEYPALFRDALVQLESVDDADGLDEFMRRTLSEDRTLQNWIHETHPSFDCQGLLDLTAMFALVNRVYIDRILRKQEPKDIAESLTVTFFGYLEDIGAATPEEEETRRALMERLGFPRPELLN